MSRDARQNLNNTLNGMLLTQRNSLNCIRLVLAVIVMVGHNFPVMGIVSIFKPVDAMAVNLFFVISGYLIIASAQRGNALAYLWRRFLRIFPGYWFHLIILLTVVVPTYFLVARERVTLQGWVSESVAYLIRNFDLYKLDTAFGHTLQQAPVPGIWNASTWTLSYEFALYLALIPICFLPLIKNWQKILVPIIFAGSLLMFPVFLATHHTSVIYMTPARLIPLFFAGSFLYVVGDYIRPHKLLVGLSIAVILLVTILDILWIRQILPLVYAYAVLGLGALYKSNIGNNFDLSYGVYLYGFPLQQLFNEMWGDSAGYWGVLLPAVICSLILASISWVLIERPALRLKNLGTARF